MKCVILTLRAHFRSPGKAGELWRLFYPEVCAFLPRFPGPTDEPRQKGRQDAHRMNLSFVLLESRMLSHSENLDSSTR